MAVRSSAGPGEVLVAVSCLLALSISEVEATEAVEEKVTAFRMHTGAGGRTGGRAEGRTGGRGGAEGGNIAESLGNPCSVTTGEGEDGEGMTLRVAGRSGRAARYVLFDPMMCKNCSSSRDG